MPEGVSAGSGLLEKIDEAFLEQLRTRPLHLGESRKERLQDGVYAIRRKPLSEVLTYVLFIREGYGYKVALHKQWLEDALQKVAGGMPAPRIDEMEERQFSDYVRNDGQDVMVYPPASLEPLD